MSAAVPVILCGNTAIIGRGVKAGLVPEYEGKPAIPLWRGCPSESSDAVIHFVTSTAAGASDIPKILKGEAVPDGGEDQIGTRDYARPPEAVIMGRSQDYDDDGIAEMRNACASIDRKLAWIRPDMNVPTPPLGPQYGKVMVERVKRCLKELSEKGLMGHDGLYYY